MLKTPPQYHTYILRFWEERESKQDSATTWRFTLENPETNERRGFQNLESLIQFLEQQTHEEIN